MSDLAIAFSRPSATPLQRVRDEVTETAGVQLLIKREDLIHPQISGNKWRKLKYNLLEAKKSGSTTLLTVGGAYSNHIYAVAAVGKAFDFRTIGVIRGEETLPLNPTLAFAQACGMHLHYVDRTTYRYVDSPEFQAGLRKQFGEFYWIPEGGSNGLAVRGVAELMKELTIPYDVVCCACGTGGTLAGLVAGDTGNHQIMGFSALKGGEFLYDSVQSLLRTYAERCQQAIPSHSNWQIQTAYHGGGYAKTTPALVEFIRWFEHTHGIPLEQVYTGKMLLGLYDLMRRRFFDRGQTIIAIHTGGLQGRSPLLDVDAI